MKFWTGLLLTLTLQSSAFAGPLGLQLGAPLSSLASLKMKQLKPYTYGVSSLPHGHPDFDDYRLLVTPKHGLCRITAWTPAISTNVYGSALREKFERLRDALAEKYGEPKTYDFLKGGSIWNEPKDFMMALKKDERTLVAYWTNSDLPDGVGAIQLKAFANTTESGMISLGYNSKEGDECVEWITAQRNSVL